MQVIEKRRLRRITVHLNAERISGDETYATFIENISETGINIMTAPGENISNLDPGTMVELKFMLTTGEILNLDCRVVWSQMNPPEYVTSSVGMEIIDAPLQYREFVKSLY